MWNPSGFYVEHICVFCNMLYLIEHEKQILEMLENVKVVLKYREHCCEDITSIPDWRTGLC